MRFGKGVSPVAEMMLLFASLCAIFGMGQGC